MPQGANVAALHAQTGYMGRKKARVYRAKHVFVKNRKQATKMATNRLQVHLPPMVGWQPAGPSRFPALGRGQVR